MAHIFGTTIAPNQTVRCEEFARQADNAIFRYEEIGAQGAATFSVQIYHKNLEDTAWNSAVAVFSASVYEKAVEGLKEQICMEFALAAQSGGATPSNCRVRVLPPQWYNDPLYS